MQTLSLWPSIRVFHILLWFSNIWPRKLRGIPLVTPFEFEPLIGRPPVYAVAYCLTFGSLNFSRGSSGSLWILWIQIVLWGHRNRAWKLRGDRLLRMLGTHDVDGRSRRKGWESTFTFQKVAISDPTPKNNIHVDVIFAEPTSVFWVSISFPRKFSVRLTEEVHFSCGNLELWEADHSRTLWEVDWPKAVGAVGVPLVIWGCRWTQLPTKKKPPERWWIQE